MADVAKKPPSPISRSGVMNMMKLVRSENKLLQTLKPKSN
jgi:hypothetical protein